MCIWILCVYLMAGMGRAQKDKQSWRPASIFVVASSRDFLGKLLNTTNCGWAEAGCAWGCHGVSPSMSLARQLFLAMPGWAVRLNLPFLWSGRVVRAAVKRRWALLRGYSTTTVSQSQCWAGGWLTWVGQGNGQPCLFKTSQRAACYH